MEQCSLRYTAFKTWEFIRSGSGAKNIGAALRPHILLGCLRASCRRFGSSAMVFAPMPGDARLRLDLQSWILQLLPLARPGILCDCDCLERPRKGTHPRRFACRDCAGRAPA